MVTVVDVSQLRRLLRVVLRGITTIIGVLLLLLLLTPSLVVVSLCSRVVWLIVGRTVGLVGAMRQSLNWGGGNI